MMERKRKLVLAKMAVVLGAIPLIIWAHASGPDVGATGAPGEQTCNQAKCHVGTAVNAGGGKVEVTFPFGLTYTPGTKQHLIVTISDPTARMFGFQLTARQASSGTTMAGTFTSTDRNTAVLCMASPTSTNIAFLDFPGAQTCVSSRPFTYIEHTSEGSGRIPNGSLTYEFDWTPPATNIGNIQIYVSGNGANRNDNETGDHIYNTSYTLTPAAAGAAPTISGGGVQNGASFQEGIVPNSWITIKGANLSTTTNTWEKAIVDGKLPTSLDRVSVNVGGKLAYIYFVSPTQINAVAPDVGSGSMAVTVTNGSGTSAALNANSNALMPAFFLWPNNQAVATRQDGSFAVKNGTFAGATTVAAKPGDVIILWGTGFGPTNPAAPVGVQTPVALYNTASPVTVTVGGTPATVYGAALSPGYAGLYQVAIQVPANAPNGDLPLSASIGGAQSPTGVVLSVQK